MIVITLLSILGITLVARILYQKTKFKICPICAGVSATWMWMLLAYWLKMEPFGYEVELLIPAILMGGSVVGIAYQIEKKLPENKSPLIWKVVVIPSGFLAVYSLLHEWWTVAIPLLIFLFMYALFFLQKDKESKHAGERVQELKDRMKNCC